MLPEDEVESGLNSMKPLKLIVTPVGRSFIAPSLAGLPGAVVPTQFVDPEL